VISLAFLHGSGQFARQRPVIKVIRLGGYTLQRPRQIRLAKNIPG